MKENNASRVAGGKGQERRNELLKKKRSRGRQTGLRAFPKGKEEGEKKKSNTRKYAPKGTKTGKLTYRPRLEKEKPMEIYQNYKRRGKTLRGREEQQRLFSKSGKKNRKPFDMRPKCQTACGGTKANLRKKSRGAEITKEGMNILTRANTCREKKQEGRSCSRRKLLNPQEPTFSSATRRVSQPILKRKEI